MLFGSGGVGETMGSSSSSFFIIKYRQIIPKIYKKKINVNVLFVKLMYIKRA